MTCGFVSVVSGTLPSWSASGSSLVAAFRLYATYLDTKILCRFTIAQYILSVSPPHTHTHRHIYTHIVRRLLFKCKETSKLSTCLSFFILFCPGFLILASSPSVIYGFPSRGYFISDGRLKRLAKCEHYLLIFLFCFSFSASLSLSVYYEAA